MILVYQICTRLPAPSLRRMHSRMTALLIALILLSTSSVEALAGNPTTAQKEVRSAIQREAIVAALRKYAENSRFGPDRSTRYSAVAASKAGLVVAYLQGSAWCGSGGCTLLILKPSGSSYKVYSKILLVHEPIMDLRKVTNGLPELGVWVQGGGIEIGYEAALIATHKGKYPLSAAMVQKHMPVNSGVMLLGAGDRGTELFQ
jgi:hypothetical protein